MPFELVCGIPLGYNPRMNWIATIATVGGLLVAAWAAVRYIVLVELRVDNHTFRTMYEMLGSARVFVVEEEFFTESRRPVVYRAFCKFKGVPGFYVAHGERMLQAGFHGKDFTTTIICSRTSYSRIKHFLSSALQCMQLELFGVPVSVATPWNIDKIGSLKSARSPIVDPSLWSDIDIEMSALASGKIDKTGAILYGLPGNGKTSLIKYFSVKYKLPIVIITFVPEFTNMDIMFMFSQIPERCIVLLEDFDNYFDGRRCIIGESNGGGNNMGIKFTFDSILNSLDGVYNNYQGVAFFMTVNDIGKVDDALKSRPSRFKYVRRFDNPGESVRSSILASWSDRMPSLNLDQLLRVHEYKSQGDSVEQALVKLDIPTPSEKKSFCDNNPYI